MQWSSQAFELNALIISLVLAYYYSGQASNLLYQKPYGYIHHSLWLNQHKILYALFFAALALDICLAQTLFQLAILVFLIIALTTWAL